MLRNIVDVYFRWAADFKLELQGRVLDLFTTLHLYEFSTNRGG